ncbi:MAG TPA: SMI1/KNR4 family protein [Flavobacteriales bacterium]|nr:SMI1/KNR4 family protein [Flavobacteriales bacterium]
MTPVQAIKSFCEKTFEDEDGETYKLELKTGLSDEEIEDYKRSFPGNFLPPEIIDFLKFTSGFYFGYYELYITVGADSGFEGTFPSCLDIMGDEAGNSWVVDIDSNGNWSPVYFVCHDPAVIIKQASHLTEFILQFEQSAQDRKNPSILSIDHALLNKIYNQELVKTKKENAPIEFQVNRLPSEFMIANLTNKPNNSGFPWGKSGPNPIIVRKGDEPVWAIGNKKNWLQKLFGK